VVVPDADDPGLRLGSGGKPPAVLYSEEGRTRAFTKRSFAWTPQQRAQRIARTAVTRTSKPTF